MKKNLTSLVVWGIIIVLGLVFGCWYFFYLAPKNNIEKIVLESLKEKLEFCEIIESDVVDNKGEFWLVCNNRPFYAEYDKGEVIYGLNGWSFLEKDPAIWEDLKECDFYDSEKIEDVYDLIFYCPRDFKANELKAKIYKFDSSSLTINKVGEEDFLGIIDEDVKSIYSSLTQCQIKKFDTNPEWEPANLFLTYNCQDEDWNILNLATTSLFPPVLMGGKLSPKERAEVSFKRAFNCEIDNIETLGKSILITSSCQKQTLIINYDFSISDFPLVTYKIDCQEPCLAFGKYFISPSIKENQKAEFVKKKLTQTPIASIYRVGDKLIEIGLDADNKIVLFWLKSEGFYYGTNYEQKIISYSGIEFYCLYPAENGRGSYV